MSSAWSRTAEVSSLQPPTPKVSLPCTANICMHAGSLPISCRQLVSVTRRALLRADGRWGWLGLGFGRFFLMFLDPWN